MHARRGHAPGFSLVEMVIVVVILGIIGSIAIPRLSGMGSNAKEVALAQNLAIMTRAVELYKAEHLGAPPTAKAQLLRFSDEDGNVNATRSYPYLLGPYLHKMPALPMGTNKGETDIVATGSPGDTDTAGWWINPTTGDVRANAPDTDLVADGGKLNELVVSAFKR